MQHVSQREDLVSLSVTMEVQKHEKKIWYRKNDASGARPLVINCKFKMNKSLCHSIWYSMDRNCGFGTDDRRS